ncbi:MAG: DJ-1/PfpI family protein [Acidobacteria bacterium]|nr:DJ-1/PfpI family protein [Acidobacteriota bacterium]MCB9397680.1 DJ-1/PfpI family protein [Acidobacteriota bacterium]
MKKFCLLILLSLPFWAQESPKPVLMVVANQDFYYPDYSEPRSGLEGAGLDVIIASTSTDRAVPHNGAPTIVPDISLDLVDSNDYSAVVFVGGWGASAYQYAFEGTYDIGAYNGNATVKAQINQLIGAFLAEDKPVAAICHGVSVLAWARVDGVSPLAGRTVTAYSGTSPNFRLEGTYYRNPLTRWHIEQNYGNMVASGSVGDPNTVADDVIVDGRIITAEDWRAGWQLGQVVGALAWQDFEQETPESLPVLMVIANQDFYYQEYGHTRSALEQAGLTVAVAAATTQLSFPHPNTGEPSNFSGVQPDLALADVAAEDYSAIVFVGGWGSSQYQYAFEGNYLNVGYAGNAATKAVVNGLIGDFVAQDKWVSAICFGVTVLA